MPLEYCDLQRGMKRVLVLEAIAYRGIRTPGLHRISRSPNGWLPRMYWSGLPLERWRHSLYRVDFVLMVGILEMRFLESARVASVVRCGRRGGRDRCGGGEGGRSARAGHGGGGRWEDGAFIARRWEREWVWVEFIRLELLLQF